jgi:hypothetical protein
VMCTSSHARPAGFSSKVRTLGQRALSILRSGERFSGAPASFRQRHTRLVSGLCGRVREQARKRALCSLHSAAPDL